MAPKTGKKSKAEEALAFLDDLDNLDHLEAPPAAGSDASASPAAPASARPSTDAPVAGADPVAAAAQPDEDPEQALAFLEAQIKQKRGPLSVPSSAAGGGGTPRTASPSLTGGVHKLADAAPIVSTAPAPAPEPAAASGGWGSFWSSATSAIQSAQRVADEQYRKVQAEGLAGVTGQLDTQLRARGVDLGELRKGAQERVAGIAKNVGGVDLDKLRNDLLTQANSTFTSFINTVAPPISAHETIELWFAHPMVGYDGVEGVVYRAWGRILEQTESGELVLVWSAPEIDLPADRTLNPIAGWEKGWAAARSETAAVRAREDKNPRGRGKPANPNVPVTTVPVFLYLQPVLAPLPVPEPEILLAAAGAAAGAPKAPPQHLYFIISLQDSAHGLQFTSVSQPVPGDWLDVEYEKSDWVEERLVDVIKTGVETVAQDYVSTRMGLKPSMIAAAEEAKDAASGTAAAAAAVTEEEAPAAAAA